MKISLEFSKYAPFYGSLNIIQDKVANRLLSYISSNPKNILDLGCGSGVLCKKIDWKYKHFIGVDFAPGMLELHPKSKKIESIYGDFNDETLFENLMMYEYDYIFSASALQWSLDLDKVFSSISKLNTPVALAIFSSGTFKTLNSVSSTTSLLRDTQTLKELQEKHFNAAFEVVEYKLEFESVREMFRYIKRSGVSGSRNLLSYREMKKLMREYPLSYLEFEVVFISS